MIEINGQNIACDEIVEVYQEDSLCAVKLVGGRSLQVDQQLASRIAKFVTENDA
jgi:hypothetical protein